MPRGWPGLILLDTNVLVYAVGGEHPLREPCRRIVHAAGVGRIAVTTTAGVIQEFVHARARLVAREQAAGEGRRYAQLGAPLLLVEPADVDRGLGLFIRHPALDAADAVLAAVAIRAGVEGLVSADQAFSEVRGLPHVAPDSPALEALLA